jgi:hypothetical protein
VLALEDDKGWDRPPCCVDALDNRRPLSIALLNALWPSPTLRACNNCSSRYHAHHEARLVKVVGVFIQDAVLRLRVLYQLEPASDNLRILAESSLVVVLSIELDFELRSTLDEVGSLVLADWVLVTLSEQQVSHIFDSSEPGRKSSSV